jgi:septal ring factor EnvC (AmiA/AmiB activator)
MKLRGMMVVSFSILLAAALLSGGCGKAQVCQTSLVTLDETRLDAETYEQEAAETAKSVADLEKKLNQKKSEIEQVKDKPVYLKQKVSDLKKGSGRE